MVAFIEQLEGAPASVPASVGSEELEAVSPLATIKDVIEGTTGQVVRASSTANSAVLRRRTSTRSRPPPQVTDEAEAVNRGVVREAELVLELLDRLADATHQAQVVRDVAPMSRRRCVSKRLSTHPPSTKTQLPDVGENTAQPEPAPCTRLESTSSLSAAAVSDPMRPADGLAGAEPAWTADWLSGPMNSRPRRRAFGWVSPSGPAGAPGMDSWRPVRSPW